jgi:mannose-6-phosphate isomerase-like protein (cupin superfamily)
MSDSHSAGPFVLGPDEGAVLEARGSRMTFKAVGSLTDGAFSLMERDLPPGGRRPPPHRHPRTLEGFFILEGEVEFILGSQLVRQGPRSFVLVPRGLAHTFGNPGPAPARVLVLHAPAMDAYFEDLQALWSGEAPASEAELALMRHHGLETA